MHVVYPLHSLSFKVLKPVNVKIYKLKHSVDNQSSCVCKVCWFWCLSSLITQGLQWFLLAEEEIAPRIIAMDGRRSRCAQSERQLIGEGPGSSRWRIHPLAIDENNFQGVSDSKLLRKLEAQGPLTMEHKQLLSIIYGFFL